jgi:aromatic-L-amino-acid/L-tryptophan decarboxylase
MDTEKKIGDMPSEEFKKYGYQLIDWVAGYLDNIDSFPVLPAVRPGEIKNQLPLSPPLKGEPMNELIADLDKIILPGVTHWQHPNFMAYFNSTASGPGILGELVSAAFNTNGMVWKSNPAATELEERVLNWFRDLIGLPENYFGVVYDSASVSTLHGIAAARENTGHDIRSKGLCGMPKFRIYSSDHAHSSVDKAALTLGIGLEGICKVPSDNNFAMIPSELQKMIDDDRKRGYLPFCVAATVGTTSSTAVDPVNEIAKICEKEKLWLHVDCAYAGVTAILPEKRKYFAGIECADSIVFNPHKWLYVPVDFSILYTRKPEILKRAFSLVPEYLKTPEDGRVINYMDYGVQLGRRFRAIKFWYVIRYFGVEGLRARLRDNIRLAAQFAQWVDEDPDFERLAQTNFGTVCFRAHPENINDEESLNELNAKLLNNVNATGKMFIVNTKLNGVFTLRMVSSGLRMEDRHIKLAWDTIKEELNKLLKEGNS